MFWESWLDSLHEKSLKFFMYTNLCFVMTECRFLAIFMRLVLVLNLEYVSYAFSAGFGLGVCFLCV